DDLDLVCTGSRNRGWCLGEFSPLRSGASTAAYAALSLILVFRVPPGAYFSCYCQGVSHAEWPKDGDEYAPTQTRERICCPRKAAHMEWGAQRASGPSKRAKKL